MSTAHLVGRFVADRARAASSAVAIDGGGVPVTYGELHERSAALAARLRAAGYGVGDRVASLTRNSADHVVVFFACARAGLLLVPLSWRLATAELTARLRHADVALLLAEDEFHGDANAAVAALPSPPPVVSLGQDGVERDVPARAAGPAPEGEPHDELPLLMLFTSGTGAGPKAALLTHSNCFWASLAASRTLPITREDVVLSVMPQFHVGGWTIQALLAWWVGATVVLERSFSPGRVLELIAGKRVTTMMGVPSHYQRLAQHPAFAAADLSSLRYAVVGGAPMPPAALRAWHDRGVNLAQGYGLTEASPNVLCLEPEEARDRAGWAGRPYPHVDVALADPVTGEPLPDGPGVGELLVRGPGVFAGYWRAPEATAWALRGGWLHTGDLARRDGDGYHQIIDRMDDVFISGGENVSPAEVEHVLSGHPAVAAAAVVGRPDPRWGEVGVAYVVTRPGCDTDAGELLGLCHRELASFKVPVAVEFVAELPRSGLDKVLRRELRRRERDRHRPHCENSEEGAP
ncbi:AMP-binding protein [Sphaerisporangium sp. NPDC051011]|uniref:class I adenylate-forming enzyme family protein n=1 Tax=Sphaerisporangium sp. NPDC051011 TaxID=3155792 RepID=UPI00340434FD